MGFSDTLISAHQGGQRDTLWCRKRRVPSCAMFHRAYFFPAPVHVLSGGLVADELVARDRVLPFREPLEVLFTNLAAQPPLLGEFAMPFASDSLASVLVVPPPIAEPFRLIRPCLPSAHGLEIVSMC